MKVKKGRLTPQEREGILAALLSGLSQNAVAKQYGRAPNTVGAIGRQAGIAYTAPIKANQARRDFCQAERLTLLNELVAKARDLMDIVDDPAAFQHLVTATAILIDKRRLEDGEATSRSEVSSTADARDRIARRIDELAARRGTKGVA